MKREERNRAIFCEYKLGPLFGTYDIFINEYCNRERICLINNDGKNEYKCLPQYKSSLFVNADGQDECNWFSVLDYEVYTHH